MIDILFEGEAVKGVRERLSLLRDKTRWHRVLKVSWVLVPAVMCIWYVGGSTSPVERTKW